MKDLDKTCTCGPNPIDVMTISEGVMEHAEGSKLLGNNKIVLIDNRAYLLDVNIDEYFD